MDNLEIKALEIDGNPEMMCVYTYHKGRPRSKYFFPIEMKYFFPGNEEPGKEQYLREIVPNEIPFRNNLIDYLNKWI